jgi:galactonate dehydratase
VDRVERAREAWDAGFRIFKLFYDRTEEELFDLIDRLRAALGPEASLAVDALWRLDEASAGGFGRKLDDRGSLWLECPLAPESPADHADLAAEIRTPIALGESYRSRYELAPFLACGCVRWLQPDLGRWGITEAAGLARDIGASARIVPHISIAMGPQIAAALQFAAASSNVGLAEYNPAVFSVANRYLDRPLEVDGAEYLVPAGPGLGVELDESAVRAVAGRENVTRFS